MLLMMFNISKYSILQLKQINNNNNLKDFFIMDASNTKK